MKISPKNNPKKVVTVADAVGRALIKGGKFVEAGALPGTTLGKAPEKPVVTHDKQQEVEISPITGKPKRQYRRRDMQAE